MSKKVALVTGANSGMGKATAKALADKGYHVIMLCRSEKRGREAYNELALNKNRSLELALCDLGSMDSIRGFVRQFRVKHKMLHLLVNNAGVITLDRRETKDKLEQSFGVNHIGHFLLTLLLLPSLEAAGNARIVAYSSGAHKVGKIHYDDINLTRHYNVIKSYGQSKLANLLFVRDLARRLAARGSAVTANACHPGAVATQMGVDRGTGFGKTIVALLRPFFLTPEQGAATAIYLATSPEVEGKSGGYYYKCKPAKSSKRSQSVQEGERLYELSLTICGLGEEDGV